MEQACVVVLGIGIEKISQWDHAFVRIVGHVIVLDEAGRVAIAVGRHRGGGGRLIVISEVKSIGEDGGRHTVSESRDVERGALSK